MTKKVSVRDFQLNMSEYLLDLPIILTRYGKNIASVNTFGEKEVKSVNTISEPPRVEQEKRQVSSPLGGEDKPTVSTIPPAVENGTLEKESPKNSQKKSGVTQKKTKQKLKLPPTTVKSMKVCPHGTIWGLGACGTCGNNERKYK